MAKKNNASLTAAKRAKNDEFYTQIADIEREMNAYLEYDQNVFRGKTILLPCDDPDWSNFTKFFVLHFREYGIKKLISTSYAPICKTDSALCNTTQLEVGSPIYDKEKSRERGRVFILEDTSANADKQININDLQWSHLDGDGDFRSNEVIALRDEADIIITNPPFSLFREFVAWLTVDQKKFSILGSNNAVTYSDIFPLIQKNNLWMGPTITNGDREFRVPASYPLTAARFRVDEDEAKYIRVKGVRWFTNIDHGRRHEPLHLMTMDDNIKYSRHNEVREHGYLHYDNYDAIEVPYTNAIPSDYTGVMGVPITFLDKYNPDQFEILGIDRALTEATTGKVSRFRIGGKELFARIVIRQRSRGGWMAKAA